MSLRTVTLNRLHGTDYAMYGHLIGDEQRALCTSLELPWRHNETNRSCIPAGTYTAERYDSPHHGYPVFRLIDVPARAFIEIHIANLPSDLLGCIGVGESFGTVTKKNGETGPGILGSAVAFNAFMVAYPEQRFLLTVADPPLDVK